ncbi:MAG: hypothetical protein FJY88_00120 [Candidatus Eisenbacteria bacterium]|nr:hypothetical protein [Candidatus Eisenbacteria bacterium]
MHQISLLLWSWIETTRCLGRGRQWVPFVLLWLVQSGMILLLTQFHRPLLSPLMVPILRLLGGEPVVHYPTFYLALPSLFSYFALAIDLLVASWTLGAAFLIAWQIDHPAEPTGGAYSRAGQSYGRLVLARLPLIVLFALLLYFLPALLFGGSQDVGATRLRLFRYGSIGLGSLFEAFFLYVPLVLLVGGRGVGRAIGRSLSIMVRMPIATFGAVLVPNLIQIPVSAMLRRADSVVRSMSPEMIAWMLVGASALYMVAAFYVVGAGSRLYRLYVTERGE